MKKTPPDITITFESLEDAAENLADELNKDLKTDRDERYYYSRDQVQRAMFAAIDELVDDTLGSIEELCSNAHVTGNLTAAFQRALTDPEIDKVEEALAEHADMIYDMRSGN